MANALKAKAEAQPQQPLVSLPACLLARLPACPPACLPLEGGGHRGSRMRASQSVGHARSHHKPPTYHTAWLQMSGWADARWQTGLQPATAAAQPGLRRRGGLHSRKGPHSLPPMRCGRAPHHPRWPQPCPLPSCKRARSSHAPRRSAPVVAGCPPPPHHHHLACSLELQHRQHALQEWGSQQAQKLATSSGRSSLAATPRTRRPGALRTTTPTPPGPPTRATCAAHGPGQPPPPARRTRPPASARGGANPLG